MSRKRLLFLGIFILLVIFLPGYSKLQELSTKNRSLLKEIEALQKENKELSQQVKKLESDPLYIEKKARDKMGIGKKGEIRYKITYDEKPSE
jgi:cell division protein FtsB